MNEYNRVEELRYKVERVRSEAETNYAVDESLNDYELDNVNQKLDTFEEVMKLLETTPDELTIVHELA